MDHGSHERNRLILGTINCPIKKDKTDFELAVDYCLKNKFKEINPNGIISCINIENYDDNEHIYKREIILNDTNNSLSYDSECFINYNIVDENFKLVKKSDFLSTTSFWYIAPL